uniref:Putative lipocalin-5 1 n=1 Tax=Amblyomma cajennense TaxID=34607 RepID=A0A023FU50_AMBCJ
MNTLRAVSVAVATLCVTIADAETRRGPHKLQRDVADISEIVAFFGDSVAVMDIDNDDVLDCLTTIKTQYDPEGWSATYLWSVQGSTGERFQFPLHLWPKDKPDYFNFNSSTRPGEVLVGHSDYFDHESCVIAEMPAVGDQCTLWVTRERKDSIPDHCLQNFEDICGTGVDLHTKTICKDVDKSAFSKTPETSARAILMTTAW